MREGENTRSVANHSFTASFFTIVFSHKPIDLLYITLFSCLFSPLHSFINQYFFKIFLLLYFHRNTASFQLTINLTWTCVTPLLHNLNRHLYLFVNRFKEEKKTSHVLERIERRNRKKRSSIHFYINKVGRNDEQRFFLALLIHTEIEKYTHTHTRERERERETNMSVNIPPEWKILLVFGLVYISITSSRVQSEGKETIYQFKYIYFLKKSPFYLFFNF